MQMRITKLKEHIGAEVHGVDLTQPIDPITQKKLYDALVDHVVLVIRDQKFSPQQYQDAAELFGELMEDQNRRYLVDGLPLISVLSNRHKDSLGKPAKINTNASWHTDHTNQDCPPKFTMLYPVSLPDRGGATSVCNMRAAFEALPVEWKKKLSVMQTENSLISSARFKVANPDVLAAQMNLQKPLKVQPLIRTHPERGTKSIWFHKNKTERIIGMGPEESQEFLEKLLEMAIKPEFLYAHEYRLNDMFIIDNRSSMHKAGFDYDHNQHRMLYRILVRGDRPF
jgi:taurine dioxygenase